VVGDVNTEKKIVEKLLALGPRESLRRSHILILKCAETQIDFVDMPNAVQSEISVVNTII
jgi:ribosomal protein L20A (L18A)